MVYLRSLMIVLFLFFSIAACKSAPPSESTEVLNEPMSTAEEPIKLGLSKKELPNLKPVYSINLEFLCEPELDSFYKKRTESLIRHEVYVLFFDLNDKYLARKTLKFNPKLIASAESNSLIHNRTLRIELKIKNKKLNLTNEQLTRPILLPDSVCSR